MSAEENNPNAKQPDEGLTGTDRRGNPRTAPPKEEPEASREEGVSGDECDRDREEELLREIEKWKQQAEENHQRFLRARADLENFRRRSRKDQEETAKYAAVPLVEALLPVLDNLERALAAGSESKDSTALYDGVEMVYRQLLQALQDHGLSAIEAEGAEFDPYEHNAVMQVETDDVEPGTVVEELQRGYRFKDRVIRPSMVKVST